MSRLEWILCERSGRWAAALRAALRRTDSPMETMPKIYEVRQLDELASRLEARPDHLALVEVERHRFGDILSWLASACRIQRHARFVALANRDVCDPLGIDPASRRRARQAVIDALREAGASEVVMSPFQLNSLLALGAQHAFLRTSRLDSPSENVSITQWAWASLPWQE
jgi:hypothetical protein